MLFETDSIAEKDELGRRDFSKSVVAGLLFNRNESVDSVVFGLNGTWGSGKSTMLSYIIDEIKSSNCFDTNKDFIYEFNPWMYSGLNQLQRQFFYGFSSFFPDKSQKLKSYFKRLSSVIDLAGHLPTGFGGVFKGFAKAAKGLSKEESLQTIKGRIGKVLEDEKFRVFVIIDDLDRLTPNEVLEVFKLVKSNSNFSNTIFLLAYDKDLIINYLAPTFRQSAERYIDKIVQIDYQLPKVSKRRLGEIFESSIQSLFGELDIDEPTETLNKAWHHHGLKNYFKTIREIKRLLNALRIRLPEVKSEVDITDFTLLEAIRLFDFSSYESIYEYQLRVNSYEDIGNVEKIVSNKKSNSTQKIYGFLFNYPYQPYPDKELAHSIRLKNPRYFQRYFSLQLDTYEVSIQDIQAFLEPQTNRSNMIKRLLLTGSIADFFGQLKDYVEYNKIGEIFDKSIIVFFLSSRGGDTRLERFYSEHYITVLDICIAILDSNSDRKKQNIWFLETFLAETRSYEVIRFCFLDYMLKCIRDGFRNDFGFMSELLIDRENEIIEYLEQYCFNWRHHVFSPRSRPMNNQSTFQFLIRLDVLGPDNEEIIEDLIHLDDHFLYFLEVMTKSNSEGAPMRLNSGANQLFSDSDFGKKLEGKARSISIKHLGQKEIALIKFCFPNLNKT